MVIVHLKGGLGNQLFQYAAGRRLAHKHNIELKLDVTCLKVTDKWLPHGCDQYKLCYFKIQENFATPEEIEYAKNSFMGEEADGYNQKFMPEVLDYPDNVYLDGFLENEHYFADIADIIRREFTLKVPLGTTAQHWREKIFAAECSVSMHIRHGDFCLNDENLFAVLPLEYYNECLNHLKQQYKNLTVFVFSDDTQWCKENLRFDVPMEFIEGCKDYEDLYLMSLCKHNIIANSTFSWWGAWLNQNPDKKVFVPVPTAIVGTKKTYRHFSAERNENSPLETDRWIKVSFDLNKKLKLPNRPIYSLLMVVNNDVATLAETLDSILAQDYKLFDLIIIDNASFDGSRQICQQAVNSSDNVTLIKLCDKISNGAAWNMALNIAQGKYVMFLKSGDKIFPDTLRSLHIDKNIVGDIVYSYIWFREDENGNLSDGGKNFSFETDTILQDLKESADKVAVISEILSDNKVSAPFATKLFYRKFLLDKNLRFDETIAAKDAERNFTVKAMLSTDNEILFLPNPFYIARRN